MFYLFLAEGFEETEALTTLDLLRRAKIEVQTVGVTGKTVIGSHSIPVIADITVNEINVDNLSGVILPGGMPGTKNLWASESVKTFVMSAYNQNMPVCAICAAPLIFGRLGILEGRKAVCYPGFEAELKGATIIDVKSVTDGNVITAKAAGAVCEFAYNIISMVRDEDIARAVLEEIYY